MKLMSHHAPGPALRRLVESEAWSLEESRRDGVVTCPAKDRSPLEPLRVMTWHIDELGGGQCRAAERSEAQIDAYATVIATMKPDVCVLAGLRRGGHPVPTWSEGGGCRHLVMKEGPVDTGKAEVERILAALKKKTPGESWKVEFPRSGGELLYVEDATTCFLVRASAGISLAKIRLYHSDVSAELGLSGVLVGAHFDAPQYRDGELVVVAPLGLPPAKGEPRRRPADPDAFVASSKTPETCVLMLSSATNLKAAHGWSRLKSRWGALYRAPRNEGSVLVDEFWNRVSHREHLLVNFMAVNESDVGLQDQQMHWEALPRPDHPDDLDEVTGELRDIVMVCNRAAKGGPKQIDELRIVDLVRAMLPAAKLEELAAESDDDQAETDQAEAELDLPCEDGALAGLLAHRRKAHLVETKSTPANDLAEARLACKHLSSHWPVITQVEFERK